MLYNSSGKLKNTNSINTLSEHQLNNNIIAKGDSAASKHYWKESDRSALSHVRPYLGPSITLLDQTRVYYHYRHNYPTKHKLQQHFRNYNHHH